MEAFMTELSWFFRWLLVSTMQVSVLVCLILIVKAMMRGRLAVRWHYWLWLLLLIRMVIPWAPESNFSIFTWLTQAKNIIAKQTEKVTPQIKQVITQKVNILSQSQKSVAPAEVTTQPARLAAGTKANSLEVIHILSLLWLGVALVLGIFALGCNFRLWRIIKLQRPITAGRILNLLEDCKAKMNVRTILGIVVTDRVKSPALFGFIRPRLLLPEGMLEKLNREQLRYVFLHELGHLKRNDIYLGWLMVILQILHWFNPLVWLAFSRMRADRELACDGLVLTAIGTGESQTYGQTLVNLFKGFSGLQYAPGIAGILENKSQLKRRIAMIVRFKKDSYKWSALAVAVLMVLGCVALTNAQGNAQAQSKEPSALAKEFVQLLVKEQFTRATRSFDRTMKAALPAEKLEKVWKDITGQAGVFNRQLGVRTEKYLSYDIVLVTCEFQKGPLDVKVVYNDKREVSGLFFLPTPQDVLKSYQEHSDETIDGTKKQTTKAELKNTVRQTVLTISTCAETDPRVGPALKSLEELDSNAVVKELITYLDSEKNTVRRSAIYILWKGGFKDISAAVPALQRLCLHEEDTTRGMAATALGTANADSSFDTLCGMALNDSSSYARRCAAYALGLTGRADARATLEKALKDSDPFVHDNAEAALKMLQQSTTTKVSEPIVIDTKPDNYANDISPGNGKLSVTFNQPMADDSWAWVRWNYPFPQITGEPHYDATKTTCTLPVRLEPGRAYLVMINSESYTGFVNAKGTAARPYVMVFATRDKNGNPTPIPEDMLAKAKETNAIKSTQPHTQELTAEIRPDGTINFKTTIRSPNEGAEPITTTSFINSDFVDVTAMHDEKGRPIEFTATHKDRHYRYNVTFNEPIPPGEIMVYSHQGRMTGLIKPISTRKDTYRYYMKHYPSAGRPTLRIETFLLPKGAELISTTPPDMKRSNRNGRIELHLEEMIPANGSITTAFQYRLTDSTSIKK
jgi:beta-lactamase regulating signal transducer with metallopeptidase domain